MTDLRVHMFICLQLQPKRVACRAVNHCQLQVRFTVPFPCIVRCSCCINVATLITILILSSQYNPALPTWVSLHEIPYVNFVCQFCLHVMSFMIGTPHQMFFRVVKWAKWDEVSEWVSGWMSESEWAILHCGGEEKCMRWLGWEDWGKSTAWKT